MDILQIETDGLAATTGVYMGQMVEKYYRDMLSYASLSLSEVFNFIKNIPYRPDPVNCETLMRPLYTLNSQGTGGDCDDKAIAVASWAKLNGLPFRFVAVRRYDRETLHHVYAEIYMNNKMWVPADTTYNTNTLGIIGSHYIESAVIYSSI